jgi:FlaA1/EpsC-like NDP-sugar epimerase
MIQQLRERIPHHIQRYFLFVCADVIMLYLSFWLSFYLRFGFTFPAQYQKLFYLWLVGIIIVKITCLAIWRLYQTEWLFIGIMDLNNLLQVAITYLLLLYLFNLIIWNFFHGYHLPKSIVVIDAIISFFALALIRVSKRLYLQLSQKNIHGQPTMVIGADFSGGRLIKELLYHSEDDMFPVVIIDNDPLKHNTRIHGIPVYGGFDQIASAIKDYHTQAVLINLPREPNQTISTIFETIKSCQVNDIRIVPKINNYDEIIFKPKSIKKISIEDLLSRTPIQIDTERIYSSLKDETVMVTGAAGSIGSEILMQLIKQKVPKIIAFEIDETEIFNMDQQIRKLPLKGTSIHYIVGDIRDESKLRQAFQQHRPGIVFHTAEYKQVELMEQYPEEAIRTNVLGTLNLVKAAVDYNCGCLIHVSGLKAVQPKNIIGASKRLAEIICSAYNHTSTRICSVRVGNALGRRGSVIPVFLNQIKQGGPITITHPESKRHFISIADAAALILQCVLQTTGGEVFVLNQGDPVQITQIVDLLLKLNNLKQGDDIEIKTIGLRPGEHLLDGIMFSENGTQPTAHPNILLAANDDIMSIHQIELITSALLSAIDKPAIIRQILKKNVPYTQDL